MKQDRIFIRWAQLRNWLLGFMFWINSTEVSLRNCFMRGYKLQLLLFENITILILSCGVERYEGRKGVFFAAFFQHLSLGLPFLVEDRV